MLSPAGDTHTKRWRGVGEIGEAQGLVYETTSSTGRLRAWLSVHIIRIYKHTRFPGFGQAGAGLPGTKAKFTINVASS
ncbi:MAG: hypothetical protein IIB00_06340 [candidate division Zixibacteria bacterium]|nr:hypothetical protein [candidate division Zixibacteria bacterium]